MSFLTLFRRGIFFRLTVNSRWERMKRWALGEAARGSASWKKWRGSISSSRKCIYDPRVQRKAWLRNRQVSSVGHNGQELQAHLGWRRIHARVFRAPEALRTCQYQVDQLFRPSPKVSFSVSLTSSKVWYLQPFEAWLIMRLVIQQDLFSTKRLHRPLVLHQRMLFDQWQCYVRNMIEIGLVGTNWYLPRINLVPIGATCSRSVPVQLWRFRIVVSISTIPLQLLTGFCHAILVIQWVIMHMYGISGLMRWLHGTSAPCAERFKHHYHSQK